MQYPSVQGGQGRSSREVVDASNAVAACVVAGLAMLAVVVLRGLGAW